MKGSGMAVIAAGPVCYRAVEAAVRIQEETGWNPSIYNIRYIKPIDKELLDMISRTYDKVITIEDGCTIGGLYGAVAEFMSSAERNIKVKAVGIPDRFISQGTQEELRDECGLTADKIVSAVQDFK